MEFEMEIRRACLQMAIDLSKSCGSTAAEEVVRGAALFLKFLKDAPKGSEEILPSDVMPGMR